MANTPDDRGELHQPWPRASGHIVFLDPDRDRPVSPYTPEGEIQMMGDFAAALSRRSLPKPAVFALIAIIIAPILLSVAAVISTWLG